MNGHNDYHAMTATFFKPIPFFKVEEYKEKIKVLSREKIRFESKNFPEAPSIISPCIWRPERHLIYGWREGHRISLTAYFKNIGSPTKYDCPSKEFYKKFFTPYFKEAFEIVVADRLKELNITMSSPKPHGLNYFYSSFSELIPAFNSWNDMKTV